MYQEMSNEHEKAFNRNNHLVHDHSPFIRPPPFYLRFFIYKKVSIVLIKVEISDSSDLRGFLLLRPRTFATKPASSLRRKPITFRSTYYPKHRYRTIQYSPSFIYRRVNKFY